MQDQDPNYVEPIVQATPLLFAVLLACFGGAVGYFNRIDRMGLAFSFFRFAVEIATSALVGIISFMLCDAAGFDWRYTAAIVAISGHMGARALYLLEQVFSQYLYRRYGYEDGKREIGYTEETHEHANGAHDEKTRSNAGRAQRAHKKSRAGENEKE